MNRKLPPTGAGDFAARLPEVWDAYQNLGAAAANAGPVSARERRLVKLALAIGAGSEGAVHSHTRQALDEGLSSAEIRQVCTLAITTLGFPTAMAAYSWVGDVAGKSSPEGGNE